MKKVLLSFAVWAVASASFAQDLKIYKAEELMEEKNYTEAQKVIQDVIANPKTKKLAFAYFMAGEIEGRIINDQLEKMKSGTCDSTLFIQALDNAIQYFTKSNEIDHQPDSKGRVKPKYLNKFEITPKNYPGNKKRIKDMLKYYGQSASFELRRQNKDSALDYLIKGLELPKNPVFTKAETVSIYKKDKAYYNQLGYFIAMSYSEKKDYDNVLKYVDYAIKDKKSMRDGYLMKSEALLAKGDTATWLEVCKQATHDMPENLNYCQNVLKYYDDHKMVKEATDMADELVKKSPDNKVAWYARGCVYMNTIKNYEEARAAFSKALEIDPNFTFAQFNQGCTYVNELMSIKDKLTTDRTKVEQYNADMAKAREYYRKALPYFENSLVLDPERPQLWGYNLQTVYYNLQDGELKEEMKQKEADMKKVQEGNMAGSDFITKYNITKK